MDWLLRTLADKLGVEPAHRRGDHSGLAVRTALAAVGRLAGFAREPRFDRGPLSPGGRGVACRIACSWRDLRFTLVFLALFMLSEAVLSVERTGLPYFVVMVDDSASEKVVDQYENPKAKAAAEELAHASGRPEVDRFAVASGLSASRPCEGAPRDSEAKQDSPLPVGHVDAPTRRDRPSRRRRTGAQPAEGRRPVASTDEARQLRAASLDGTARRAAVGDAVADRRPDDRRTKVLAKAAELAARKGVPLYTVGLGSPEPARDLELTELLVDDVVFVDDLVRFQAKLLSRGFAGQEVTVRLREHAGGSSDADPAGPEIASVRVKAPADGQPATRRDRPPTPRRPARSIYTLEVDPKPRELQCRQQPHRTHRQRPQGKAQGPSRRQRAALRISLSQELPRTRGHHRPERRPHLVRPGVQRPGPLGPRDLSRRQRRPLRLRRRADRRRRPELPQLQPDAEPRGVRHRKRGRHPIRRRRGVQPAGVSRLAPGSASAHRTGRDARNPTAVGSAISARFARS